MAAHSSTYHHLRSCLLIGLVASASGFASVQRSLHASSPLKTPILLPYAANYIGTATSLCSTQTDVDTSTNDQLGGVATFEEWFTSNSSIGAKVNSVKHALFHTNSLRGLEFTSKSSSDLNRVAVVPRKMVLSVPYSEDDEGFRAWDTNLSVRLWEECKKGKSSAYYGLVGNCMDSLASIIFSSFSLIFHLYHHHIQILRTAHQRYQPSDIQFTTIPLHST
jgi:hypothetical protein